MTRAIHASASGLWRNLVCIGSAVLEQTPETSRWSRHGTAVHAFLCDAALRGREAALAEVADEDLRAVLAQIDLSRLPVDPAVYVPEVAFGYAPRTGRAHELGREGKVERRYAEHGLAPDEIPSTADVVALVGDDAVYVGDYKTGFSSLPEPALNWQFRFLGLAAARAYGRTRAIVEMIRVGKDGEPYKIGGELGLLDLVEIAERIREFWADATRAAAADVDPPILVGEHCRGCPSIRYCGGSTGMVRANPEALRERLFDLLAEDRLAEVYEAREALREVVKRLDKELDDIAWDSPFALRDGRIYGRHGAVRKTSPDGPGVWHYLAERIGPEKAWEMVKISSSWDAIDELARTAAAKNGSTLKAEKEQIRADLAARGAVKITTYETCTAKKPAKEKR